MLLGLPAPPFDSIERSYDRIGLQLIKRADLRPLTIAAVRTVIETELRNRPPVVPSLPLVQRSGPKCTWRPMLTDFAATDGEDYRPAETSAVTGNVPGGASTI